MQPQGTGTHGSQELKRVTASLPSPQLTGSVWSPAPRRYEFPYHLLAQLVTGGLVGFVKCEMLVDIQACQNMHGAHCDF